MGVRYGTGDKVPVTGLYLVRHGAHRLPHEALLLKDEVFPRCGKCADKVEFELLRGMPGIEQHRDRVVRIYELPAMDEDEAPGVAS